MKKSFMVILAIVLMLSVFTGCNRGKPNAYGFIAPSLKDMKPTITGEVAFIETTRVQFTIEESFSFADRFLLFEVLGEVPQEELKVYGWDIYDNNGPSFHYVKIINDFFDDFNNGKTIIIAQGSRQSDQHKNNPIYAKGEIIIAFLRIPPGKDYLYAYDDSNIFIENGVEYCYKRSYSWNIESNDYAIADASFVNNYDKKLITSTKDNPLLLVQRYNLEQFVNEIYKIQEVKSN